MPENLTSLSDWQRLLARALQTGGPVTVETTVSPRRTGAADAGTRRATAGRRKRAARKKAP
jgi:hypothetical protein